MDERAERAQRRFHGLLDDARAVIRAASQHQSPALRSATSMLVAVKAMHRAGGFLEAIVIAFPDLGRELIVEFEQFALEVEETYGMPVGDWIRRNAQDRRTEPDRRDLDHRSGDDRRLVSMNVLAERRLALERRVLADRRVGDRRALPDRRFGTQDGGSQPLA